MATKPLENYTINEVKGKSALAPDSQSNAIVVSSREPSGVITINKIPRPNKNSHEICHESVNKKGVPPENPYSVGSCKCPLCPSGQFSQCGLAKHVNDFHKEVYQHECPNVKRCLELKSCFFCSLVLAGGLSGLRAHVIETHLSIKTHFPCPVCLKTFNVRRNLLRHLCKIHHIEKLEEDRKCSQFLGSQCCAVCSASFFKSCDLDIHLQNQREYMAVNCPECRQEFTDLLDMTMHFDQKHINKCGYCQKKFKTLGELAHHQFNNLCTFPPDPSTGEILLICDTEPEVVVKNVPSMSVKEEIISCMMCCKVFETKCGLQKHIIMRHTNLMYCRQCLKEMYTHTEMRQHIHRAHEKDFEGFLCYICDQSFGNHGVSFTRHLKKQHNLPDELLHS